MADAMFDQKRGTPGALQRQWNDLQGDVNNENRAQILLFRPSIKA